MSFCNYCGDRGPTFQHCKSELEARSKCGIKVNPTAYHEAPTLDECIADSEKDVMFFAQIATAEKQLEIAMANKKFLERLHAIENAKRMPECPTPEHAQHIQFEGCDCVVMSPEEYEALYLHAQHETARADARIAYEGRTIHEHFEARLKAEAERDAFENELARPNSGSFTTKKSTTTIKSSADKFSDALESLAKK